MTTAKPATPQQPSAPEHPERLLPGAEPRLLAQYHESYETLRHRERLIWQLAVVGGVLNGAFILGAFLFAATTAAREAVLLVGAAATFLLLLASFNQRFLMRADHDSLFRIESELGLRHLQRPDTGRVETGGGHWVRRNPSPLERWGGGTLWLLALALMLAGLVGLAVIAPAVPF